MQTLTATELRSQQQAWTKAREMRLSKIFSFGSFESSNPPRSLIAESLSSATMLNDINRIAEAL